MTIRAFVRIHADDRARIGKCHSCMHPPLKGVHECTNSCTNEKEFMVLPAIETRYKGYRFRSRLEARWAVFFDALGTAWEYEKEGFDLGKAGWYLPDFWLPRLKCWIEIKGQPPTKEERLRCTELAEGSDYPVHLFWGEVAPDAFWDQAQQDVDVKRTPGCDTFIPSHWSARLTRGRFASWSQWQVCSACGSVHIGNVQLECEYFDDVAARLICQCQQRDDAPGLFHPAAAYEAARSARFEHGESGYGK